MNKQAISEPQTNFTVSPRSSNGLLAILTNTLELEPVLRILILIRIHMFWGLLDLDPDPLAKVTVWIRIL
jgi:hypothetical protein